MIRLTLADDGRLIVHGSLGEREIQPDEADMVRDALSPKPMPLWFDMGVVACCVGAVAYWSYGGMG